VPDSATNLALVAGGVGMPPLSFFAETLRRSRPDVPIALFYGGRSRADLLELTRWQALGVRIFPATDDGSYGDHGLVTAPLHAEHHRQPFDYLAACGPRPMLRAVQQFGLAEGIPGQLSLEARMACGVGACLGCVCAVVSGNRRVCVDGPVFALDEVRFDV
jgi:dihydroorotate dehydrogenase electron transfer subunit